MKPKETYRSIEDVVLKTHAKICKPDRKSKQSKTNSRSSAKNVRSIDLIQVKRRKVVGHALGY